MSRLRPAALTAELRGMGIMADAASLKLIGILLGSVTAAVMMVAVTLVSASMASTHGPDMQPSSYALDDSR